MSNRQAPQEGVLCDPGWAVQLVVWRIGAGGARGWGPKKKKLKLIKTQLWLQTSPKKLDEL